MGDIDVYPPQNVSAQTPMLGYAQVTANQSGIGTVTDLTGLAVTVTVPAGRRIRIIGKIVANGSAASSTLNMLIREGSTYLQIVPIQNSLSAGLGTTITGSVVVSPSAGTHTYKLSLELASGSGTVGLVAGADHPAFILVEDITGSQLPVLPQSVPVGQLAYAEAPPATSQAITSTPADVVGCSVNIVVPAGRVIKLTASSLLLCDATAGRAVGWITQDGVTALASTVGRWVSNDMAANAYGFFTNSVVISPSAGAHTYALRFYKESGAGSITIVADPTAYPTSILVEDISPTPAPGQGAPGSTLGYAQVVADQSPITSEVDLTGLSVTVTVPEGRRLQITAVIRASNSAVWINNLYIKEGTTRLQHATYLASTSMESLATSVVISPTAGSHTYKLAAEASGSMTLRASSTNPAYILVEDITGAVWPVGSTVTAGMVANEAWTTYVPTLSNITLGNGTRSGRYMRIGRTIHAVGYFSMGSTSSVSGRPSVGLPVTAANALTQYGSGRVLNGGDTEYAAVVRLSDTGPSEVMFMISGVGAPNGMYNGTTPFAMGTGDAVEFSITYEAAS